MINNFQDLKEGGALIGVRTAARAWDRLDVGLTWVVDLDQYSGLMDSDGDGYPDAVDAFPGDHRRALDNDGDGVPDDADSDDDNDGIIDVDPGSGLPADIAADLIGLNAAYGNALFPVDEDVARRHPFNRNRVGADRFGILGLDLSYPLATGPDLQVKLYGQVAVLLDDDDHLSAQRAEAQGVFPGNTRAKGWGITAPGLWARKGPLRGQLEFRHFRDDFDSAYFDDLYELDRARLDVASGRVRPKDARLNRGRALSGIFGQLTADLSDLVRTDASYQYLTGGGDPKQQLSVQGRLTGGLLRHIPRLQSARAYYQKNNIGAGLNKHGTGDDGFFESTEDTFYGYALSVQMAGDARIIWDTRYVFRRDANLHLQRHKVLSIETVFGF